MNIQERFTGAQLYIIILIATAILFIGSIVNLKHASNLHISTEVINHSSIDRIIVTRFPEEINNKMYQVDVLSIDGSSSFTTKLHEDELKKLKISLDDIFKQEVKEIPKGEVK